MSSSYSDANYSDNFDSLIASVESLDNPATLDRWTQSVGSQTVARDLLPAHIPCVALMRVLKTCVRSSRGGINSCIPQLRDLERCSASLYVLHRLFIPQFPQTLISNPMNLL
jgi:hypothetical protein